VRHSIILSGITLGSSSEILRFWPIRFGVGELSALNAQAGAFSEHVPILHIAGVPNTSQLKNKPLLHHTLGDGRFDAYTKAAQQFSIADAQLMNKNTACAEIDRVLTAAITLARPVYLTLPTDIVYEKVPSGRLNTPLDHLPPPNDQEVEDWVINEIVRLVKESKGDVIILVDACTIRHYVRDDVAELVKKTNFPVYSGDVYRCRLVITTLILFPQLPWVRRPSQKVTPALVVFMSALSAIPK
jgi:pyruvate decarboxylase